MHVKEFVDCVHSVCE